MTAEAVYAEIEEMARGCKPMRCAWVLALLLGWASAGWSCSCGGPGPVCSINMKSTTIFRGTVIELTLLPNIQTVKRPDGTEVQLYGNGRHRVRFAVEESFSGNPGQEAVVYTNEQSSACGYSFQAGREYVVFSTTTQGELWTSHCSRTALLEPGKEDPAIAWMRGFAKRPSGSQVFGQVIMPAGTGTPPVPARLTLGGLETRTASTDVEGRFDFSGLRAGDYTVAATVPPGYLVSGQAKVSVGEKGCTQSFWYVAYDGRINGQALDRDGLPVADLRLQLQAEAGAPQHQDLATTGPDGRYHFERVSPGSYRVTAQNAGALTEYGEDADVPTSSWSRTVQLESSATQDNVDFRLSRLRRTEFVRVRVMLPDGTGAQAGLELFAFPNAGKPGDPTRTARTGADGWATLPLFAGRQYAVSVSRSSADVPCGAGLTIQVTPGMTQGGVLPVTRPELCKPQSVSPDATP